jgi:hypothetical protein
MLRRALVLFSLLAVAGCTGSSSPRDAGDSTRSLVRVNLSYTRSAGSQDPSAARFDAQAHFVRYRSFDSAAVPTILGFTDFETIPLDSCRVSDGTADLDEALSADGTAHGVPAEVALLDAGRIELKGPADRASLRPRHYPELVPFVSGVVYGSDDAAPVQLGLGQPYQVSGDGGEEVGPFAASVAAPRAFPSVSASPLRRGSDLDVRWSDAEPGAEPLLLEVKWSSRLGARAVRCRVRDDGDFSIPHDSFDALPAAGAIANATITAIRQQRSPIQAPGAGRGEFTVELRDVAPLQVAP